MTTPQQWWDGPSFELGIDNESENISLSQDEENKNIQDALFEGERISHHNDEVTAEKKESLNGIEDGASASKLKHDIDLNEFPNEVAEEAKESSRSKNLCQKVVQPYERAFLDLNRGVFDLNKFPDEGLEFGPENQELKKGFHDMLKILVDSSF